jgi:hypothetical protein
MTQDEALRRVEACTMLLAGGMAVATAVAHTRAPQLVSFGTRAKEQRAWALMAGATMAAVLPEVEDDG